MVRNLQKSKTMKWVGDNREIKAIGDIKLLVAN